MWYLIAPATGSNTVVVTHEGIPADLLGCSVSYNNVHQTSPFGTEDTDNGASSVSALTINSASGEMVVDALGSWDTSSNPTVTEGQTPRGFIEHDPDASWQISMSEKAGAASVDIGWSTQVYWAYIGVPLKPLGGGSTSSSSQSSESSDSSFSSDSSLSSNDSSQSSSSSSSELVCGDVCWGHDTAVEETYIRDIADGSGTGTQSGTGDSEKVYLKSGEYWEFETWCIASEEVCIDINKYLGDATYTDFNVYYKTGTTKSLCEADTWHLLIGSDFVSNGWVKVRVEAV